ncbi:MAG: hypothetical protein JOY99_01980 [Sphingomonadaceae bacterium]|nr:hypothetical protein [Sphingomonadaceae bacterium]
MTEAALTTPAARPLPTPMPLFELDPQPLPPTQRRALWEGWQGDIRFFLLAYLAGFVFFLALLS